MKQIVVDMKEKGGVFLISDDQWVTEEKNVENDQMEEVQDKFFIVRWWCFIMGLVHFVPLTFFTTANDYWMYKFRDTDDDLGSEDTENRTTLQSHFAAATTIATCVPLVIFIFVTTTYGHLMLSRKRIYLSVSLMLLSFAVSTIFIELNTDTWQIGFFVTTMTLISIINAARAIYRISIFEVISKFPQISVAFFLAGEGLAGIFNSVLQIISLVIGTSTKTSALIYFISGCAVMLFSLFYYKGVEHLKYYKKYICDGSCSRRKVLSIKEIVSTTKQIWSSVVIILCLYMTQSVTSPAITSLVVSEDAGSGEWSDVYFVPVVTFLLNNVCDFIGRTASSKINKTLNGKLVTVIMVVRVVIFVPFIMLCNARPRHHLPVIFPHDYQYIIIIIAYGLSGGYFFNAAFMTIPSLVPEEHVETAYAVLVIHVGLIGAIFSVLSFFCVDLL